MRNTLLESLAVVFGALFPVAFIIVVLPAVYDSREATQ